MIIKTKRQFVDLWTKGLLGNKLRTWQTLEELYSSAYRGNVTIRSRKTNSPCMCFDLPFEEIESKLSYFREEHGQRPSNFYFGEVPDDSKRVIQGELIDGDIPQRYYFQCSFLKEPLRSALIKSSKIFTGISTLTILRQYCDPCSYNDLMLLLDAYPGHVIEFSVFERNLGIIPNRNTIIWEVRHY